MKKIFTLFAVAALAFAAQANVLTVAEGEYQSSANPVYGLWFDTPGITQQIYPAEMLAEMSGCQITEISFFTIGVAYESMGYSYEEVYENDYRYYINFDGADVELALMETNELGFTEAAYYTGATVVASATPVKGERGLTFVLNEPFQYNGGNLLVQASYDGEGSYGTTYFWGAGMVDDNDNPLYYCSYYGYENYSGELQGYTSAFLPAAAFTYEESVSEPAYYVVGGFNGWDYENGIEVTEEGATIEVTQQDFNNPDDTAQEFKIVTTDADGELVWLGGVDDNQVGYFEIGEELLEHIITLDDEGVNFRLAEPGNYTIRLVFLDKAAASGMFLYVTKNEVTAVNGIASKAIAGVKYYNLAGVESSRPFKGINVVVTTYTDGTTSTTKVVK